MMEKKSSMSFPILIVEDNPVSRNILYKIWFFRIKVENTVVS